MFNLRCTDEGTNSANATKRSGPVNNKQASNQEGNPDNLINNQEAIMKDTNLHKVIGPGGGQTLDQQGKILTDVEEDGLSLTQESEHARTKHSCGKYPTRNGQEKSRVTCCGESKKAKQPDERG